MSKTNKLCSSAWANWRFFRSFFPYFYSASQTTAYTMNIELIMKSDLLFVFSFSFFFLFRQLLSFLTLDLSSLSLILASKQPAALVCQRPLWSASCRRGRFPTKSTRCCKRSTRPPVRMRSSRPARYLRPRYWYAVHNPSSRTNPRLSLVSPLKKLARIKSVHRGLRRYVRAQAVVRPHRQMRRSLKRQM